MSFKGNIIKRKYDNGKFVMRKNLNKRSYSSFRSVERPCKEEV